MKSPKYCTFGEAIELFFSNYGNFSGRSTRSEYFWWLLFNFLMNFALNLLGSLTHVMIGRTSVFTLIWELIVFIPCLSLCVRRLHDTGKSGALLLIPVIALVIWYLYIIGLVKSNPYNIPYTKLFMSAILPLISGLVIFIFYLLPSEGPNQYGPGPGNDASGSDTGSESNAIANSANDTNSFDSRNWICDSCGKVNSPFFETCECGMKKRDNKNIQSIAITNINMWQCKRCGTMNSNTTGTCGCGMKKRDNINIQSVANTNTNMWQCKRCGSMNSNTTGTCGCGMKKTDNI